MSSPDMSSGSTLVDRQAPTEQYVQRDTILATDSSVSCDESKGAEGPSDIEGSQSKVNRSKMTGGQPLSVEENSVIVTPSVRPTRIRKKPDFLVVGDVDPPRFNRSGGH